MSDSFQRFEPALSAKERKAGLPPRRGLYDPEFEHDACGIGMICDIKGRASHKLVTDAIDVLCALSHRGASGADELTGDGAGVLTQLPHEFFKKVCAPLGIGLPEKGAYGVGMLFLSRDEERRARVMEEFGRIVAEHGQTLLGWREVPVNVSSLGRTALQSMPHICQVFIQRASRLAEEDDPGMAFERQLYLIRRCAENRLRYSEGCLESDFYACSLSSRTIVYKGMLQAWQLRALFVDLSDLDFTSAITVLHSRYSTNTFPSWERAHPNRMVVHNGEINTIRGNCSRMLARQSHIKTDLFGDELEELFPIVRADGSDSAMFDNALEFLTMTGRSLTHAAMMMIPQPWEKDAQMSDDLRAFYEFHSHLMDPWDGPAAMVLTNGIQVAAVLDRNGLRPARYLETRDGRLILASETGTLPVEPENILYKERLRPGRMLLIDTEQGRVIKDDELKQTVAQRHPYAHWIRQYSLRVDELPAAAAAPEPETLPLITRLKAFGYTNEQIGKIIMPMAEKGAEAVGAMGTDSPLAILSDVPQLLYDYFHQLFAQVTNPPIDALREEIVTSSRVYIGAEGDLLRPSPLCCRQIALDTPMLTNAQLAAIRALDETGFRSRTISILYPVAEGGAGMRRAIERMYAECEAAVAEGVSIVILSDRGVSADMAAIPALLAVSAVQTFTTARHLRTQLSLILESAEPRETHHFALLLSCGVTAVNPYLIYELLESRGMGEEAVSHYNKAAVKGVIKILSKMGISTVQSFRGSHVFEAVGLGRELIDEFFPGTVSRVGGLDLDGVARERAEIHEKAFVPGDDQLEAGGVYQYRSGGEYHLFNPETIHLLQKACREGDYALFKQYSAHLNRETRRSTLRSIMKIRPGVRPIPIGEVESVDSICRRFKTGAMSYGSISQEAHECLAIAMNRLGGRSNTGEGGEDAERFVPLPGGDSRRSSIKQVASGRVGVTINYLVNADEIQIKMAQGAKPGEGGQLPGGKVYPWVAKTRHSTPGVPLISPPPHHDIYSIEDLAELIYDLKNANPEARISVKLAAEAGVGTIAAGVAKGQADVILISGYDGGTGAAPRTSIKHAGLPWELGLSEAHQTLTLNGLRSRVKLETDGKLLTGRDVAIAAMLGAQEFGFATAPLIAMGCCMMRVCNLDTCPVGIATQNPELRKRFSGKPEYVVNFMRFVAQELREIMAEQGMRTLDELVGRSDLLAKDDEGLTWKQQTLDISSILDEPEPLVYSDYKPKSVLSTAMDAQLLKVICSGALEKGRHVTADLEIHNVNRAVGTYLGSLVCRRYGEDRLPAGTIHINFTGSAGQSFGAFMPRGMTFTLTGDANDYLGKGLSGGIIAVKKPADCDYAAEDNIIIGNVALYGATSGEAYVSGVAGERFCVRNSGATAVVEGVGDHGCEYMTGGRVLVIGRTGRNFAAGMSGGIAYVYDGDGDFGSHVNTDMVEVGPIDDPDELVEVRAMLERHVRMTGSRLGARLLASWGHASERMVRIIPTEYRKALEKAAARG